MRVFSQSCLFVLLLSSASRITAAAPASQPLPLSQGWVIQSSAAVKEGGKELSSPKYRPQGWHEATVPTTVVSALVKNGVYPDPYYGKNLRSIPGTSYPIGENFSNLPMPADSPFAVPWWFRTEFVLPADYAGKTVSLHFDGINYRANLWLNERKIGDSREVAGAFRMYEFDVSELVQPGKPNVLAVEIFAPTERDLAITFVDWNPQPPDKNMGLWRRVYITAGGPVTVRHPFVESRIDFSSPVTAHLTVVAELKNHSKEKIQGTLRAAIGEIRVEQPVELEAGEGKEVVISPEKFSQLTVRNPRLWWPAQMGSPELYDLQMEFEAGGRVSDRAAAQFGIREITSELQGKGRVFKVNGKPILIRGGGWTSDLMLRENPRRLEQEIRYVQDMGLNTIRLEGKLEPEEFFEITDRLGLLVMAGWCCCDHWEKWSNWKPEDYGIAAFSQRDQIKRLRGHASLLVWLNASDIPPPPDVESMYIGVLKQCRWPNPYISSAAAKPTPITGDPGVKMTGPWWYVAPSYWLEDKGQKGGAWGFNTETSMGPAVPPIESLRLMLPEERLWPINDDWEYHSGGGPFKDLKIYTDAQNARYGPSGSAREYTVKSQAMAYEGVRAMFEAYSRNKYQTGGVIQWMMNNAWPSTIWHLYDWYLRPAGGYFGAKKACEPLHPQYSYDDRSVWVVSSQYQDARGLKLTATIYDLNMVEKFKQSATVDAAADSATRVLTIPEVAGLSSTYFLLLTLEDGGGKRVSSNLYWLSTKPETIAWGSTDWYTTLTASHADFTALNRLPKVRLEHSATTERKGGEVHTRVTVKNPSKSMAFLVRLKAIRPGGEEVLPVLWEDNYFALMPGEQREITATHDARDVGADQVNVTIEGWNVAE